MNPRMASRSAWSVVLLSVLLGAAAVSMALSAGTSNVKTLSQPTTFLLFSLVGAVIVTRDHENRIGWILLALGLAFMVMLAKTGYVTLAPRLHDPGVNFIAWLDWLWVPISVLAIVFLPLLFPTGRLLSPRWRIVVWSAVAFIAIAVSTDAIAPGNPLGVRVNEHLRVILSNLSAMPLLVAAAGALASLVVRWRRSAAVERQQLKWFVVASVPFVLGFGLHGAVNQQISDALITVGLIALPISIGLAILKYRLYEIDVVINKSLVYAALAAFISAVYVGIVVGVGSLFGNGGKPNLGLSIVATAIVAVAFQPVRQRLQRLANRLVYGRRATPYEVMADFAERMAGALSVDDVLPKMAEAAAQGVGARTACVTLFLADGEKRVARCPDSPSDPSNKTNPMSSRSLPISYRGDDIGELAIVKSPGEPVIPAEDKLLRDLAFQAGLVLHNVRLTLELQARLAEISSQAAQLRSSRQRLVSAQDSERQRLEQMIHDGAERDLAAMTAELSGVPDAIARHPQEGIAVLERVLNQANNTLEGLRDLARGVYPPLLRDGGLSAALEAQANKAEQPVALDIGALRRYPSEVEAAVYFCCLEALHGATGPSRIRVAANNGHLDFSVAGTRLREGVFQQLEDRVEALGGRLKAEGERLVGSIPVDQFFLAASQAATSRSGSNFDFEM